jgi:phosphoglycerate kinase
MPTINSADMLPWLQTISGANPDTPKRSLQDYLKAIPRLETLADLPSGTAVLVRGDVDAKPGPTVGEGDIRLRSMKATLDYGRQHGWKQIVFGHIGRKPEETLAKVGKRLSEILGAPVQLVDDWLDGASGKIRDHVTKTIAEAAPGAILLLENTRKYDIERVLWKAKPADLPALADKLTALANEFTTKIARAYVHEAFSAGSLDASSIVAPAAMDRVAMGRYEAEEFDGPMIRCLSTQLVVFSGLKIDKLDDLTAMIHRGTVEMVFTAGSLAMALKKASAELEGKQFSMGVAEDPAHADKPYYIPRERIEQSKQMLTEGRAKGIDFVLPVDFVLGDGRVADTIGPGEQQFDVGPKTSQYFAEKVGQFIAKHQGKKAVAFHNGVFGMFEDPRFENGTREFVGQLRRMKEAGVEVYVGGGEGGAALERYGKPDDVTHCFTAGGTVLNALGSEPVPYLVALSLAAKRSSGGR